MQKNKANIGNYFSLHIIIHHKASIKVNRSYPTKFKYYLAGVDHTGFLFPQDMYHILKNLLNINIQGVIEVWQDTDIIMLQQ
jgi:hypothetical protein